MKNNIEKDRKFPLKRLLERLIQGLKENKMGLIKLNMNRMMSVLLIIYMGFALVIPQYVMSEASESVYRVKNSAGETVLTIRMKDGMVTIEASNKPASPGVSIRWQSIGLTITRVPIKTRTTTKGYTGPGPVKDGASQGMATIYFDQAFEKTSVTKGNVIYTTTKFSADQIKEALKDDFSDLKKGTTIYLHGVFRSINYQVKNGKEIRTTRKDNLKNWKDIMNAEYWAKGTLDGFSKYYNMEIKFMPDLQNNSLYYVTEDGMFIAQNKSLLPKTVDDIVYWKDEPDNIHYYNNNYRLKGYYVTRKLDKTKKWVDQGFLDKGVSINNIKNGHTKVLLGGMEVYLVYQKDTSGTNEPTPTPNPNEPGGPIEIPKSEKIIELMEPPVVDAVVEADRKGDELFEAATGIPTTESLYTQINSSNYLLGYHMEKRVGVESYPVKVRKTYTLSWTGMSENGETPLTERKMVEQVIHIDRAYGYWEIINFDLYSIDRATIYNYALPDESSNILSNNSKVPLPNVEISSSSLKKDHIIIPEEILNGITLPTQIIYGGTEKPSIPKEDLTAHGDEMIPALKVRNDSLIIDDQVILNNSPTKVEGPKINAEYLLNLKENGLKQCEKDVLYKSDQVIGGTKENGTYHSSGNISYKRERSIQSKFNSLVEYNIPNINSVVIHTPVVCEPIVFGDNEQYVQLYEPSSSLHLVLDPKEELNDFTLQISNNGYHSLRQGYKERDYSHSLRDSSISYVATKNGELRNEVKFPFDVYWYNKKGTRTLLNKNTWFILGKDIVKFSIPIWVGEGNYTISCRTIAVNADQSKLDQISEPNANTKIFNYVATNNFDAEISGRLYGLTIYDITDYPIWEKIFRTSNSLDLKINDRNTYMDGTKNLEFHTNFSYDYTIGIKDQYGKDTGRKNRYTFPLINNSHPKFEDQGVLKTGYGVRFKLTSIGNMFSESCSIVIKPRFYFVDTLGKNRQEVDIYYEEAIDGINRKLVKVGNSLDGINVKFMEVGSPYVGIPDAEIQNTVNILNKDYMNLLTKRAAIFNFSHIQISSLFRTFLHLEYKYIQNWYGYYYLPAILYAAPKDYDVYDYAKSSGITFYEDFWLDKGYIIVNFDIMTIDEEGKPRLSYVNKENHKEKLHNNMWITEGGGSKKSDYKGNVFQFEEGDFIMYSIDNSIHDDHKADGIY